MKRILFILPLIFCISCENIPKKSDFECFNKIDIRPKYDNVLDQEKFIKEHLDDYFNQFLKFYQNAFEKLDTRSNFFGILGKVTGSVWDSKGMIGMELRHKSLKEKYSIEVLKQIDFEIKKINILIYYTYYERINYYRSTIPNQGEPLNSSNIHPRFFAFKFAEKDKLYNELIERTFESLREFENNLAKVRIRKSYHSLYLDSECDLTPLVEELISYLENPEQEFIYQYEFDKLGLKNISNSWDLNNNIEQQITLWSQKKKEEFENYRKSYFNHLINEISTLNVEINFNSPFKEFINDKNSNKPN